MTSGQLVAVALATVVLSTGASAADLYGHVSLGPSSWKVDGQGTTALDKNDTGLKLVLGAQLTPNVALEGGYADLGKARVSGYANGFRVDATIKGSGVFADVVGRAPLTPEWGVFGKLGVFNGSAKVSGTVSGAFSGSGSGSTSDSGTEVHVGLGADCALSKSLQLRAEWERFRFNVFADKGDVDLLSLGLNYRF